MSRSSFVAPAWRIAAIVLAMAVFIAVLQAGPMGAWASIYIPEDSPISSSTNPGDPADYEVGWREGWGNSPVARFDIKVPQPNKEEGEPAILGAFYAVMRPSTLTTLTVAQWPDCYNAILVGKALWPLAVDIPAEAASPGPLNLPGWTPPPGAVLTRPYEGPYTVKFQFFAPGVTDAWSSLFLTGLDMTPPLKVEGLTARAGYGTAPLGSGTVLTQSRVFLQWDDIKYDSLAGTGYFEAFIDGQPYATDEGTQPTRRVYDMQEHYPGYGFSIFSRRGMTIEDLPAGTHTLQVRAVDRATNAGPLSDPVTVVVDPDLPSIQIKQPSVDGQAMGARPTFEADVGDEGGVAQVRFYVDGVLRATRLARPFTAQVDLSAFADGTSHTLRVEADDVGGRTNFAEKAFVIDKTPRVTILAPEDAGDVMSAPAQVSALVKDAAGVESVTMRVDGSVVATFAPASSDTTRVVAAAIAPVAAGPHTLEVTAVSTSGGSVTVSKTFTADPTKRISTFDFGPPLDEGSGLGGTSETNPYTPDDPKAFWRELWGNSVFPQFTVDTPSFNPADQAEMLYAVDRNAMSQINPAFPATYDRSSNWQGTEADLQIDQRGLVEARPGLSGTTLFPGRATDPVEGIWFWHVLFRDKHGKTTGPYDLQYGVDVTPPSKVTGVAVYEAKESAAPSTGWIDQARGVLKWNNAQQDALSGTAYYRVYIDGACVVPGESQPGATLLDPDSGPAGVPWYREGRAQESLTLEDFGPGIHTVQISAVDRAGNEGALSDPVTVRMIATPEISIQSPSKVGEVLTTPSPLRAQVNDAAGVLDVTFAIDGSNVATFTPSTPGAKSLTCAVFQPLTGGPHTLVVRARSISGTTQLASRAFVVDGTLPPVVPPPSGGGSGETTVTVETEWFRSAFPTFKAYAGTRPENPTELLYLVDRTPTADINPMDPNSYYGSFKPTEGTTHFNGVIDQLGVYRSNPTAFDGAVHLPGKVSSPLEGIWYIHALVRNAEGLSGERTDVAYGVDLTAPLKVNNVRIYADNNDTTAASGWLAQSRAVLRWDGAERDALSGTDHFNVYIDGKPLSEWENGSTAEPIEFQRGRTTMSLTFEDLPLGLHTFEVTAVDEAGNESPRSDPALLGIDYDVPKLTLVTPGQSGARLGASTVLSARAQDEGGVASVNFRIDGLSVGTVTPSGTTTDFTAKLKPIWTEIPSGEHTLEVRVTDKGGQTAVASRTFTLDRTAPSISGVSAGPSPFYPRKRDGYKDNYKVKFTTSEAGTAKLVIRNSSGKIVRTISKSVSAGSRELVWDGKQSDGGVRSGTFRWTLTVTDSAGNARSLSPRSVSIRFYEIRRTAGGGVRIVQR